MVVGRKSGSWKGSVVGPLASGGMGAGGRRAAATLSSQVQLVSAGAEAISLRAAPRRVMASGEISVIETYQATRPPGGSQYRYRRSLPNGSASARRKPRVLSGPLVE